ncbi:hypothetical protein [Streptomyces sp. NPDC051546]|uniref:hypothetical protein n=1 Tax=Streptomyces sp. NPDC051546 TaxID=3365655 RepID=UPI00378E08D7
MVSLDKTAYTISYGKIRAKINIGLRQNNLLALSLEFGERAHLAAVTKFEAHKAEVLAR